MSRISTYEVVPVPKLADKLIGTSVGGEIEDITYNFTLQELLNLFIPFIPANNLQGVLNFGNTATQDINLFGTITTTNLDVTNISNLFITYLNHEVHIVGGLFDSSNSIGTPGQVLISTGLGVDWYTLPPIFTPNLQQVLTEGNTSNIDILLNANIQALDIISDTATFSIDVTIDGTLTDGVSSIGTSGKILSSTGAGVQWVDLPIYSATSPLFFNSGTGVFSIQVANGTQDGYLTSADWITFNGKQNAGNYITALTGEATATGPGSVAITLTNSAVIGKVLTGLSITGAAITSTDTILQAFGKAQNQINGKQDTITLTTTGTSGAATLIGATLNIPNYSNTYVGTVTSVSFTLGTSGTDLSSSVTNSTTTPSITLNVPTASASARGALSAADWTTFNSKQDAITLTTTGSSGASTFISNTLNVPTYTLSGLGGVPTSRQLTINGTAYDLSADRSWSVGTVTSVGLTMPVAFSVANSPITSSGSLNVTAVGTAAQYIRGDGQLATLPTGAGGGSAVNYYLNGSIAASVATYFQMSNSAVIGGGTDFNLVGNGLISQFLTDVGNPNRLLIPGGAWNFEMFFSVSSAGGNQKFYIELLKYNGSTFTSIASGSANPEEITGGTTTDLYLTSLAVPETVLLTTDRLAVRVYIVDNSGGRTVTLHTEDNNLCLVTTTFAGGISALNGLTANTQYFAVGTSGTDFNISSLTDTHTFNLPTASATNRGALSSANWSTFNAKQDTITLTTTGSSGAATFIANTLNIPNYGSALSGYVPYTGATGAVNLGAFDLTVNLLTVGRGGGAIVYNTALGINALFLNTTGQLNTAIGYNSGYLTNGGSPNQTSQTSVYIGADTRASADGNSNEIVIGCNGRGGGSNSATLGNSSIATTILHGNTSIGYTTNPSLYKLDVNGTGRFSGQLSTSAGAAINSGNGALSIAPSATRGIVNIGGTTDNFLTFANKGYIGVGSNYMQILAQTGVSLSLVSDASTVLSFALSTGAATFSSSVTAGATINLPNAFFLTGRNNANTSNIGLIGRNTSDRVIIDADGYGTNIGGGGTVLINPTGGNVGIGNLAIAGYKLDVNGTGRFVGNVTLDSDLTYSSNAGFGIVSQNGTRLVTIQNGAFGVTGAATFVGNVTLSSTLVSNAVAIFQFRNSNSLRWELDREGTESGSNAGSNLTLYRYDDSGNYLGTAFTLTRSTGAATFSSSVTATAFFESSSIAGKNIIKTNPLTSLDLDVIQYTRKTDESKDVRYGYSAEQIHSLMPELTDKDVTAVKYLDVHTLLIAQLQQEIKELKAKLN